MISVFLTVFAFSAGFAIAWLIRRIITEKKLIPLEQYEALNRQLNETLINHASQIASLQATLKYKEEKLSSQQQEMEHLGEQSQAQFRLLANTILEEKTARFSTLQEQSLKAILEPLKEHISTFKKDYEGKQARESEERISLREQIRHMMELNKTLSDQANSLTQALRGNVKQQGNWGEMILESMLQHAGLQKNYQYFLQEQSRNSEGQIIQPDVIVRYPDNRAIVIDSKVSLVHYESYCGATDKEQQETAIAALVRSVKNHIDGLSGRSYHDVANALDFVMMFVPVEAAYITAMQADAALWQYAYKKKILLISPANLIAAMKLVADMWQRDSINREAHLIADKAGKLYDKLVLFVDNFERIGVQLQKTQDTWQDAYKQLSKGKGNAIAQAEQMKSFNAKTTKSLPTVLIEEALLEDGKTIED